MNSKKETAITFLEEGAIGDVDKAYEQCTHTGFIHHNLYFKGDRDSLRIAMKENQQEFPDKTYTVVRALEDGNLVTVHGKVILDGKVFGVIHIFRFEGDKIIEMWEAHQEALPDSPNENGLF